MCAPPPYGTAPVRILEILQRVNTGASACKRIVLVAAGRFLLLFLRPHCGRYDPLIFVLLLLLFLFFSSLCRVFFSVAALYSVQQAFFFRPALPSPRLHAKANTTLIYLPVSAGTRVIYCDLIAFNSSGATVNHRASRIARVRHARCRYDVITSIRESVSVRPSVRRRGCENGDSETVRVAR